MFDLAGAASNAGMSADEADELLAAYFGRAPEPEIRRAHAAMQCASLLREAMWSMVSELHLDAPGVDYVAYTAGQPGAARSRARRLSHHLRKDPLMNLPTHAEIVVIGGGIIGCSTAYHLARDHKADVVLLEQGKLTSGSTWHAAGLVGQLRSSASITRVLKYSVDLYKRLDAETGLATGWKMTGCLRLATNQDRWTEFRRLATTARSFGMDMHLISPAEVKAMWPLMEIGDLVGAIVAADRRPGQPVRHHAVARQGRAHARREALRGRARHRFRDEGRPHHRGQDRPGRHRLRQGGQLRRPMGAAGRRHGRRQRAAAAGQASVHHHREDRRARRRRADDPRSRPAHLFQGRGRRPGDGRLRAEPAGLDDRRRAGRLASSACSTTTGIISSSI